MSPTDCRQREGVLIVCPFRCVSAGPPRQIVSEVDHRDVVSGRIKSIEIPQPLIDIDRIGAFIGARVKWPKTI